MTRSLRTALDDLRLEFQDWLSVSDSQEAATRLEALERVVKQLGAMPAAATLRCPPNHRTDWESFVASGEPQPTPQALRSLCWEPSIASDPHFMSEMGRSGIALNARQVQGLVHSLHAQWSVAPRTFQEWTSRALTTYVGRHRLVKLWKDNASLVVSQDAAERLAADLVLARKSPDSTLASLQISQLSQFARACTVAALQRCREGWRKNVELLDFALEHLLPWKQWDFDEFHRAIGDVIVDKIFDEPSHQQRLLRVITADARLGDPRLHRNRANWTAIPEAARQRVIQWLSRLDIVFFFEHVLPDRRRDHHGRKEFWLRYVRQMRQSRPLLSDEDFRRLRAVAERESLDLSAVGAFSGDTSAFVMEFDSVVAVEFSKVGNACYLYQKDVFRKLVPDLYKSGRFSTSQLKAKSYLDRMVHKPSWKWQLSAILRRHGITE
jgi:hypothetical protein